VIRLHLVVAFALRVAVALCAAVAAAQEGEYELRSVGMFNQHLYFGDFSAPRGLAFDRVHDELWVADTGRNLIGVFRPDGVSLYSFFSREHLHDPVRIAVAPDGHVLILDRDRSRIHSFNYRGVGKGDLALADLPKNVEIGAVAFDGDGNLYVGENRSGQIFVFSAAGKKRLVFGSRGPDEGEFESICGIVVNAAGDIVVLDQRGVTVQVFDSQGNFIRGWGRHEMGAANFSLPSGIALDSKEHVIVTDELRHEIKLFDFDGRFLGRFGGLGSGKGEIAFPTDVAVDRHDRIYVSERSNSRVQLFEFLPAARRAAESH